MKESISPSTEVQTFPYFDKVFQYGLMVIAFSLLFVSHYHVSELLFIGLLIVWLTKKVVAGSFEFEKTPLDIPIVVFFCWVLLAVPFATDWTYSIDEWRKAIPRFLIFWFVVNVVNTEQQVRGILFSFSVGLLLLVLVESVHFFSQGGDPLSMTIRAGSLSGSSQWLSYYLVIGFPILVLGLVCAHRPLERTFYSMALGLTFLTVIIVHTRAVWVAMLLQISVYVLWKSTRRWLVTGVVASLIVCVVLSFFVLLGQRVDFLSKSGFSNTKTMSLRWNTWNVAMDDIREHPLLGIGYGKHSFKLKHPELKEGLHTHVHNSFLSHAVQVGIPGFLALIWIFWRVVKHLIRHVGVDSNQYKETVALAMLLLTVGVVVRNLFDDMFMGTVTYLFWLLVGLSFSLNKTDHQSQSDAIRKMRLV